MFLTHARQGQKLPSGLRPVGLEARIGLRLVIGPGTADRVGLAGLCNFCRLDAVNLR